MDLLFWETLMVSKRTNREKLYSKFSKKLVLALTFKQILKKQIFLTLHRTYKMDFHNHKL